MVSIKANAAVLAGIQGGVVNYCIPLCTKKIKLSRLAYRLKHCSQMLDWQLREQSVRTCLSMNETDGEMRKLIAGILTLMTVALTTPVNAQSNMVVVELYTSQGCSSCPPADDLLTKLAERDDVIALALHVDYWDYIGWADIFADPSFTVRQRSYAQALGNRMIYTPQMIIGGSTHVVGSKVNDVISQIDAESAKSSPITLAVTRKGGRVLISASSTEGRVKPMIVQLVRFEPLKTTAITRGENAGRTINYTNIVTSWDQVKKWDGTKPLNISVRAAGSDNVAVIVQADGFGQILAAVQLQ